jgi:hypothetical protein
LVLIKRELDNPKTFKKEEGKLWNLIQVIIQELQKTNL